MVVQKGGRKARIPLALEVTDKGTHTKCAAPLLARIVITQDPARLGWMGDQADSRGTSLSSRRNGTGLPSPATWCPMTSCR